MAIYLKQLTDLMDVYDSKRGLGRCTIGDSAAILKVKRLLGRVATENLLDLSVLLECMDAFLVFPPTKNSLTHQIFKEIIALSISELVEEQDTSLYLVREFNRYIEQNRVLPVFTPSLFNWSQNTATIEGLIEGLQYFLELLIAQEPDNVLYPVLHILVQHQVLWQLYDKLLSVNLNLVHRKSDLFSLFIELHAQNLLSAKLCFSFVDDSVRDAVVSIINQLKGGHILNEDNLMAMANCNDKVALGRKIQQESPVTQHVFSVACAEIIANDYVHVQVQEDGLSMSMHETISF